jgi:hypothetical protein
MASKKLKKILMAGAAAAALSAARNKSLLAATEDGKGGIDTIQKAKQAMTSDAAMKGGKGYKDSIMRSGAGTKAGSIGMGQKIKNFLTKEVIKIPKTPGSENFGLGDMDGAKYGKMIKANNGVMVEARGNKLARSKPTKLY